MKSSNQSQVVYYAAGRYKLAILSALVLTILLSILGTNSGHKIFFIPALFCLIFMVLFSFAVRKKLKPNAIALAREGNSLVGLELPKSVPIDGTSFEIQTDFEGSWVIILYSQDSKIRLSTGGWKVEGKHLVTKTIAEDILLSFGLQKLSK